MARREVLKSALGAALLAPFLRQRELYAQNTNPKRLILVFTPDSHPPEWWPTGAGADFALQEPLADFAGLESEMLFVRQLDHSWSFDNHHESGIVQLFTGGEFYDDTSRYSTHPSIDHVLLQNTELRGGTPRDTVNVCVDDGRVDKRHIIAYSGPNQPVPNEPDPGRAFQNVFEGVTFGEAPSESGVAPEPATDPVALAKQAVDERIVQVDMDQVRYLQRFLGQEERERLDIHLESLEDLQRRIQAAGMMGMGGEVAAPVLVGGACESVSTDGFRNRLNDADDVTQWAQMQSDIIVNAFTCDVTRSAVMQYSFSGGHHEGLLGFSSSWHDDIAHVSKTDDTVSVGSMDLSSRLAFGVFDRFWAGHIAYLAKRLSAIAEGDGTMLDNTLIYWGVESGTNHSHNPRDMQYLLIGGRNMGFALGQFLNFPEAELANKLHVSVLQGFGLDVPGFGIEEDCGALAGIIG
jgi:Protein of unknown function (DUF1552)